MDHSAGSYFTNEELETKLWNGVRLSGFFLASTSTLGVIIAYLYSYDVSLQIGQVLIGASFLTIALKVNRSNYRKAERIMFVLATLVIIVLALCSNTISTISIFFACVSYLFFVEDNKAVRWGLSAAMLITLGILTIWFFPNLTFGNSSYDLRYEALGDVVVASIYTGLFLRKHLDFSQMAFISAKVQAKEHDMYVDASRQAYQALNQQKIDLAKLHDEAKSALLNERLTRAQIEASQDQLEQFAYAASHDLKEPIRTIRSFLQVVRRRLPAEVLEDEQLAEHFEFVETSSDEMNKMLERLLIYSRIERTRLNKKPVDLPRLLQRLLLTDNCGIAQENITINLPEEDGNPFLYMCDEHAKTVFTEILHNAALFQPPNQEPRVCIDIDVVDDKQLLISINDNGIGIDKAYHTQVFGLFQRLNTREAFPGSGLGLSLAQSMVEGAGGQISLSSRLGEGTQVHMILPRWLPADN
jgi:signal transduction histidine kinase